MHYALPQRKSSHPPAYAIKPKKSLREQRQLFAFIGIGILALILLLYRLLSSWSLGVREISSKAPYGQPDVVVVTTINPEADPDFVEKIKANRIEYSLKHGKV
jgi:mannan polymerase II complex MNN11 subunit